MDGWMDEGDTEEKLAYLVLCNMCCDVLVGDAAGVLLG